MPYVDAAGVRLYYEELGDGRPVVLLHGAGQDTYSWRYVAPEVGRYARALALDLPGHGKSELLPAGPVDDLGVYAGVVAEAMDALQLAPVTLVGHSMSAGVALLVALRRPELVSAVIAVDGGGETNRTHGGALLDLVAANPAGYFEENFRSICSPRTPSARIEAIAWDVARCHPDVVYADIRAYSRLSIDDRLSALTCPVTFLHGVDDWSIPIEIAEASAKHLSNAHVVPLPGTGHFPHVENPEDFNAHLGAALGEGS